MTLGTRLLTWLRGELVSTDLYGNRCFREWGARPVRRRAGQAREALDHLLRSFRLAVTAIRRGGHRAPATGDYERLPPRGMGWEYRSAH